MMAHQSLIDRQVLLAFVGPMCLLSVAVAAGCGGAKSRPVSVTSRVNCSVSVQNVTADTVTVAYRGLPGNRPQTYANKVAIWNSSVIPWGFEPVASMTIPQQTEQGTVALNGVVITDTNFVVGYSVGPDSASTCASAQIGADGGSVGESQTRLEIVGAEADAVVVRYHTLDGYQPSAEGNWVGLWVGRVSPYDAPAALARKQVATDSTDGTIELRGLRLKEHTPYTLIYFLGPDLTEAGAMIVFQVQARKQSRHARRNRRACLSSARRLEAAAFLPQSHQPTRSMT
jgi:hypothetical protein